MPFATEDRLFTLFDVPLQLPQTALPPGAWLAVSTVLVQNLETIDLRWLQIQIVSSESADLGDPCGNTSQAVINEGFSAGSLVSVFLIKDWIPNTEPWSQNVVASLAAPKETGLAETATIPVMSQYDSSSPFKSSESGSYSVVVLNNTSNKVLHVVVNGTLTLDSDPI